MAELECYASTHCCDSSLVVGTVSFLMTDESDVVVCVSVVLGAVGSASCIDLSVVA